MLNILVQIGLVGFTGLGFLLVSLKYPEYGLLSSLISQIFWLISSYKAGKYAGQWGIFINTLIITIIVGFGVWNYWFPLLQKYL